MLSCNPQNKQRGCVMHQPWSYQLNFENENMTTSPLSAENSLTSGPVAMIFTKPVQASPNYHGVKLSHEGSHCLQVHAL
jgi:hypothetical protein